VGAGSMRFRMGGRDTGLVILSQLPSATHLVEQLSKCCRFSSFFEVVLLSP